MLTQFQTVLWNDREYVNSCIMLRLYCNTWKFSASQYLLQLSLNMLNCTKIHIYCRLIFSAKVLNNATTDGDGATFQILHSHYLLDRLKSTTVIHGLHIVRRCGIHFYSLQKKIDTNFSIMTFPCVYIEASLESEFPWNQTTILFYWLLKHLTSCLTRQFGTVTFGHFQIQQCC